MAKTVMGTGLAKTTSTLVRYLLIMWLVFLIFFGWGVAAVKYEIFPWAVVSPIITEIEAAIKGDDEGSKLDLVTAVTSEFQKVALKHMREKDKDTERVLEGYARMGALPGGLQGKCLKVASSYDNNLALLLIGNNGTILHRWDVNYDTVFGTENENNNSDINGSLLLPDGSVVVNYAPYKGIARFDMNGNILWKNDALKTHHSVTLTMANTIWVPGREILQEGRHGQIKGREEDMLYELDLESGSLIRKIYTVDIFFKNSIHGLYEWIISEDKVHVNDIQEVGKGFAQANAGLGINSTDIIMTGKRMNIVMIVDPETLEAKYVAHLPWNQPHDTDPLPDGNFLLFDNNQAKGEPAKRWGPSRILLVDPDENEVDVYFTEDWFYSPTRSDQELYEDNLLITSDENGYLVNIHNGKPNYWYIHEANNDKNWYVEDARWVDPAFFSSTEMRNVCAGEQRID